MGLFGGKKKRTPRSRNSLQGGALGKAGTGPVSQAKQEQNQVLALGKSYGSAQISFSELITRLGAFYEFTGGSLDDAAPLAEQGFDAIAVAETVNALQDIFKIHFEVEDEELYALSINELQRLFKQ